MKSLIVMAISLVVAMAVVPFLSLSAPATQGLVAMLAGNALLALVFALMTNWADKE